MPKSPERFPCKILLPLIALLSASWLGMALDAAPGAAASALHFSFDRPIDAAAAPFVVASGRGLFRSEGLNVTTDAATGSLDAFARVASGNSHLALADINALIRSRDT